MYAYGQFLERDESQRMPEGYLADLEIDDGGVDDYLDGDDGDGDALRIGDRDKMNGAWDVMPFSILKGV